MTGHGALGDFFQTMGYDTWKELGNYKSGSQIAEHLESSHHGFDELSAAYQGASEKSYDAFLRTLEQRGPQQKISCPLTNCMRFCYEYLKSKQKERAITNAINDVKDALVALSTSRDISTTNDFSDLKQKIGTLLGKIHGFNPNHGSSRPGSSGTVSAIPVPKNLKEAIDWVLWMPADDLQGGEEGKEAIKILATKILTMLLRISLNGVQAATLLQGDIGEYGSNFQNYQPIVSLRKGVKDFIGYSNGVLNGNGIGARGVYLPAYSANSPFVQSLKANEEKIAKVFIGFIPLLFFGLTFLYWQCSNDGEWSKGTLSNGPLRQFLAEMGFTQGLNEFKSCAQITDMFSTFNEFKSAGSSNIDYFAFLKKVESATKSMLNTQPTSVPLGALYYFVFEYLKTKISNSSLRTVNVTPKSVEDVNKTLKGLSSAVKSLIPQDSEKLSNAYQKLLDQIRSALEQPQQETPAAEAVGAAANTAAASHAGSAGEHPASSQVQSSSGGAAAGSIFGVGAVGAGAAYSLDLFGLKVLYPPLSTSPIITGAGILPASVARHKVGNAVLNFVIRFLEVLCGIETINDSGHKQKVLEVIGKLRKCLGTGKVPEGFQQLVDGIAKKADGIDRKVLKSSQGKLKEVFTQLKVIKPEEMGTSISSESQAVEAFLGKVDNALKEDSSVYFKTYCEKLAALLKNNEITSKVQKDQKP
ncbi:variant erythrocyte surface antigen-1 family protein [Babesia caballi]|uniref:Variant erythrocyte surface antigen-1 family protein n=1 Tax=Babesia caballi TaxID=5871 RepID=A0AAV4LQY0_BABCB|nr:variant erythrocyte surface antigen-1 family protein [Babesia caballi]